MNASRLMIAAIGVMVCAGCSIIDPFAEAKEALRRNMKDPEATQFRDLSWCEGEGVRGEYNSKNSYGAYVGFKDFIFVDGSVATIDDDVENGIWDAASRKCWGKYYVGSNATDTATIDNIMAMDEPAPAATSRPANPTDAGAIDENAEIGRDNWAGE